MKINERTLKSVLKILKVKYLPHQIQQNKILKILVLKTN